MDKIVKTSGCFMAGDDRFEQTPMLSGMHAVFLRLHNKFALKLGSLNRIWSDEIIFQETRRLLIAIYQHIIYSQWLPIIIGNKNMEKFNLNPSKESKYLYSYDEYLYPQLSNEFVTAGMRLHNFIHEDYQTADKFLKLDKNEIKLETLFYNQSETYYRADEYGRGNLLERTDGMNMQMADALNNFLFQDFPKKGDHSSMGTINIQV
jgi:peroxidase